MKLLNWHDLRDSKMKIVIDTNVIVSAALWGGIPRTVLEIAQSEHVLCFSIETLVELKEVFGYPKFAPYLVDLSFSISEFIDRLTEKSVVTPSLKEKTNIIKEDPSDNKFLICAFACQADFIVSGDRHLLKLKEYQGIKIITPKEFVEKNSMSLARNQSNNALLDHLGCLRPPLA